MKPEIERPWSTPRRKETCLIAWREEHPGQPDPDDDELHRWLVEEERKDNKEWWREEHPGEPLPEYQVVRRWAINEWNECKRAFAEAWGLPFREERPPTRH